MILEFFVIIGALLDTATFLMLPTGAEANPLVTLLPLPVAIILKGLMVMLLLTVANMRGQGPRTRLTMLAIGIATGFLGFGSNLAVVLP